MTATNIYEMAQTWNNGAVDFTAIKMNVTDTASGAGSLLLDLQVGASSKFKVEKDGGTTHGQASTYLGNNKLACRGVFMDGSNSAGVMLRSDSHYGFSPTALVADKSTSINSDTRWYRDASGVLAQRNGINAQEFRLYNTYTDASNYERGFMRWESDELKIGTEKAGTGTYRNVRILAAQKLYLGSYGATSMEFDSSGVIKTGPLKATPGSTTYDIENYRHVTHIGYHQLKEMTAPAGATDVARIYAEDDGSGKTRLMVQFQTGAAQQIAIEP